MELSKSSIERVLTQHNASAQTIRYVQELAQAIYGKAMTEGFALGQKEKLNAIYEVLGLRGDGLASSIRPIHAALPADVRNLREGEGE